MNIVPFGTDLCGRMMSRGGSPIATTIQAKFWNFDLGCGPNLFLIFLHIEFCLLPYQPIGLGRVGPDTTMTLGTLNSHVEYIIFLT